MREFAVTPVITTLIALLLPIHVAAQEANAIRPGDRVRVASASASGQVDIDGTISAVDGRGLLIEGAHLYMAGRLPVHGTTVRVTRDDIRRIEVYRGTKSGAGTGALIGAAILGVAGGIAGVVAHTTECQPSGFFDISFELCGAEASVIPLGIAVGAATGGLLGALIGLPFRSEKWDTVPIEAIRITPDVYAGGVSVQIKARL